MYKFSDDKSQAIEARLLKEFEDLPFSDKLHMVGEIFKGKDDMFLSSGINSIGHILFTNGMAALDKDIKDTKSHDDFVYYMKTQDELEAVAKSLNNKAQKEHREEFNRVFNKKADTTLTELGMSRGFEN